jgi:hypothetical protein
MVCGKTPPPGCAALRSRVEGRKLSHQNPLPPGLFLFDLQFTGQYSRHQAHHQEDSDTSRKPFPRFQPPGSRSYGQHQGRVEHGQSHAGRHGFQQRKIKGQSDDAEVIDDIGRAVYAPTGQDNQGDDHHVQGKEVERSAQGSKAAAQKSHGRVIDSQEKGRVGGPGRIDPGQEEYDGDGPPPQDHEQAIQAGEAL